MTAGPDEPDKRKGRKAKKNGRKDKAKKRPRKERQRKPSPEASKPARNSEQASGEQRANLIRAIDHSLRRRVLRILTEAGEPQSPAEIRRELDMPLGAISYQIRVLRNLGAVKLTRSRQVRGALEHFYATTIKKDRPIQMLLDETRKYDER